MREPVRQPPFTVAVRMPNWIGDAVMASPVIRAVKSAWPASRLVLVAKDWAAGLFGNDPLVDRIISLPGNVSRNPFAFLAAAGLLKKEKPDVYVALPYSFSTALLGFLAGVPVRVGRSADRRDFLLTVRIPPRPPAMHRTDYYLSHISAIPSPAARKRFKGLKLEIVPSRKFSGRLAALVREHGLARGYVGVNPNAVAESRRWPADRWVSVLEHLKRKKKKIVLFGSAKERPAVEELNRKAGSPAVVLAGELSLSEFADILTLCGTFVTNDSGPMHMAFALGLRVVGMIGAADEVETGPYNPAKNITIINKHVPCSPCVLNKCPKKGTAHIACLTSITADEITRHL
jgi:heptosyltransferase-2